MDETFTEMHVRVTEIIEPGVSDAEFIRGDSNADSRVDIADPVWTLSALFLEGPSFACVDAADANDDTVIDLSDVLFGISHHFRGGLCPVSAVPRVRWRFRWWRFLGLYGFAENLRVMTVGSH